jgi:hypothetical protein
MTPTGFSVPLAGNPGRPVFIDPRIPDFLSGLLALSYFMRLSLRESRIRGRRRCWLVGIRATLARTWARPFRVGVSGGVDVRCGDLARRDVGHHSRLGEKNRKHPHTALMTRDLRGRVLSMSLESPPSWEIVPMDGAA